MRNAHFETTYKDLFKTKALTLIVILNLFVNFIYSQARLEKNYPKILQASNDSFFVRFSNLPDTFSFKISEQDTTDVGTDGAIGLYATIYIGKDSIRIDYKNLPFDEVYWFNIQSPKGKTVYRLHFNRIYAVFSQDYIQQNINKISIDVPEVYELANIIWTLSPSGQRADNLNNQGVYYEKVKNYFKPYLNHAIFKKLDFDEEDYMSRYFDFRENSFAYSFAKNNKLVWGHPYFYVDGGNANFNSLFKELIPLIEDFAQKSNYRTFYKSNLPYYDSLKKQELQLMPIKEMWQWLENQFPNKFLSYKIVFSPLISATHSTQNFFSLVNGLWFSQTVMFVSGPTTFYTDKNLNEKQKEGLASGIVFTEIDHNYVNPVSGRFKIAIDSIFSRRDVWTSQGGDTKFGSVSV